MYYSKQGLLKSMAIRRCPLRMDLPFWFSIQAINEHLEILFRIERIVFEIEMKVSYDETASLQ